MKEPKQRKAKGKNKAKDKDKSRKAAKAELKGGKAVPAQAKPTRVKPIKGKDTKPTGGEPVAAVKPKEQGGLKPGEPRRPLTEDGLKPGHQSKPPGKKPKPQGGRGKPGRVPKPLEDAVKPGKNPKPLGGPDVKPGKGPKPLEGGGGKPGKDPEPQDDGRFTPGKDPKPGDDLGLKVAKNPLLMMPMRLEYRVVSQNDTATVLRRPDHADDLMELRLKLSQTKPDDVESIDAISKAVETLLNEVGQPKLELEQARLENRTEIWLRWYPDDSFAEVGVAPASKAEIEALEAFLATPQTEFWPKLADGEMSALWGELVAIAGEARAVHLMRAYQASDDPHWESRIGRIAGLPERVAVFAMTKGELTEIGRGRDIPANTEWGAGLVSYSPAAVGDGSWVSDYNTALELGMGLKLSDDRAVELALEADWLVCVGLSNEAGPEALTQLLNDQIASGGFEILQQDTPTNNTPSALAGAEEADTVQGRLADNTSFELGALQDKGLGCELLGTALGIETKTLMQAKGSEEAGNLNAAAMIRVIGPALMDGSLAATSTMNDVSDTAFIELLAQHVQARGVLPSVRVGTSAYGILPVTDDLVQPAGNYDLKPAEADYQDFIRFFAQGVRPMMVAESEATTLRMEPDDPDASEKLTDILQTSRVSRRLDVANQGEDEIAGLGCPYVAGPKDTQLPHAYLVQLKTMPVRDLFKPDENDTEWPLLYRLAHLSVTRNRELLVLKGSSGFVGRGNLRQTQGNWMNSLTAPQRNAVNQSKQYSIEGFHEVRNADLTHIPTARRPVLKAVNARFSDALTRLRGVATQPDGIAHLETLMMEVVDLFQHRLDAWITGLASIRLARLREGHSKTGLVLGYYGMLGKLRTKSATVAGDGYIQAPSQGQAVTAAILRSAFLRNRAEGAFEIDLSARRTSRALKVMDHIRHGVPLPECLGLRGERWLRDRMKSLVIYELREAFPLENPDVDGKGQRGPTGRRCFDGLKFLEAIPRKLTPDQIKLQKALHDDMDALADLVVAEAVHHRAAGAADVASAWLRVLSGGPVPHRPEFLRTYRSGHASDYRVTLVLPQVDEAEDGSPLRLAEYGLAALMDRLTPALNGATAMAQMTLGTEVVHQIEIHLDKHLGLDAIHLAKLGIEPLKRRLEAYVIADLHAKLKVQEMHKLGWVLDREGIEAAGLVVTLDLGGLEAELTRAAELWQMAHAGQPLSAGDLSNAADPKSPLEEAGHIAALQGAAADLWARVDRLYELLKIEHEAYRVQVNRIFRNIAIHYEKPGLAWGENLRRDQELRTKVTMLHSVLVRLQRLGLDGTITRPAASRLVGDMVGRETELRRPLEELRQRITRLGASVAARNTTPESLSDARADMSAAIAALQLATGMQALAIFPVFGKTAALTPLLLTSQTAEAALGPWPRYRARLGRLLDKTRQSHSGYAVHPDATANDKDAEDADLRPEAEAPRAYHHGVFLAGNSEINAPSISGIVVDEWVEKRPSTQQDAAIALNYDSPQAEAPNSLILGVPEDPYAPRWDEPRAAHMVSQMLDLMKMRALTTQTTPLENTVLPLSNLVAHLGNGQNERPRLPLAIYKAGLKNWFAPAGKRQIVADIDLNVLGGSWNQTNRYGRKRRGTP